MLQILVAFAILAFLTLVAYYFAGREMFVFGVAAAIATLGEWGLIVGVIIAVCQAVRLSWRWYTSRAHAPSSS